MIVVNQSLPGQRDFPSAVTSDNPLMTKNTQRKWTFDLWFLSNTTSFIYAWICQCALHSLPRPAQLWAFEPSCGCWWLFPTLLPVPMHTSSLLGHCSVMAVQEYEIYSTCNMYNILYACAILTESGWLKMDVTRSWLVQDRINDVLSVKVHQPYPWIHMRIIQIWAWCAW